MPNVNVSEHKAFRELDMIALALKSKLYRRKTARHSGAATYFSHRKSNVRHHLTCVPLKLTTVDLRVPRRSPSKTVLDQMAGNRSACRNFKPEQSTRAFWRRGNSTHDNNAATRLHFMGMESRTLV